MNHNTTLHLNEDMDTDAEPVAPSLKLQVDTITLDYTAYNALRAILSLHYPTSQDSEPDYDHLQNTLATTHSLLKLFRSRHTHLPLRLKFRLCLLRFAHLLHRAEGSTDLTHPQSKQSLRLKQLRRSNRDRAETWWAMRRATYSQSSLIDPDTADALACKLEEASTLPSEAPDGVDKRARAGTASTDNDNVGTEPSLLDILPMFVELASMRSRLLGSDGVVTEQWMQLATEFMVQAFMEQRLRFDAQGCSALLEAFAWGPIDTVTLEDEVELVEKVNRDHDVFLMSNDGSDSDSVSVDGSSLTNEHEHVSADRFNHLRDRAISELIPDHTAADTAGLFTELIASRTQRTHNSRSQFKLQMWNYLRRLSKSVPKPMLTQLEEVEQGSRTRIDQEGWKPEVETTERLRRIWARGSLGLATDQLW